MLFRSPLSSFPVTIRSLEKYKREQEKLKKEIQDAFTDVVERLEKLDKGKLEFKDIRTMHNFLGFHHTDERPVICNLIDKTIKQYFCKHKRTTKISDALPNDANPLGWAGRYIIERCKDCGKIIGQEEVDQFIEKHLNCKEK